MTIGEYLKGTIRYSAFKDYSECPYKFKVRYLDGVRSDNKLMAIGRTVEHVVNEVLEHRTPSLAVDAGQARLLSGDGLVDFYPLADIMLMAVNGLAAICELSESHGALPGPMLQKRLKAALNFGGQRVALQVTPDFIFACKDGSVLLVDLKTCGSFSTWNERRAMEDAQLNLYSTIVSSMFNGARVHAYYVCVNRKDFRVRVLPSACNPEAFMNEIYWSHQGMLAGRVNECRPGFHCKFCEVSGRCPATINRVDKV